MADPLDSLEIIIDVVDSFSEEIDELLADLENVDLQSERVDDIYINVHNLGEDDIAELQSQLQSLTDEEVDIDVDVEDMDNLAALGAAKRSVVGDENVVIDIDVDGMGELLAAKGATEAVSGDVDSDVDLGQMLGWRGEYDTDSAFDALTPRMTDLHNILARLVPLIATYVMAMPAVIGGVIGLGAAAVSAAASLAALGGLAFGGLALQRGDGNMMQGFSEIMDDIQSAFMDAFEPLMDDLAPLATDAVAGLETMFQEIAAYEGIFMGLRDEARAFGGYLQQNIPEAIALMGQFTEAAAPALAAIGNAVDGRQFFEGLTLFMSDVLPALFAFGRALGDVIFAVAELSVGFAMAASVLTDILVGFINFITLGGLISNQVGFLIGMLFGLYTILSLLYTLITANVITAIASLGKSMIMLAGYNSLAATASYMLSNAIQFLTASVWRMVGAVAIATGGLYAIVAIAGAIASQFMGARSEIDKAADSLERFSSLQDDVGSMGGMGGPSVYEFTPSSRTSVINAESVDTGKRVANYKSWKDNQYDNYTVTN